MELNHFVLRLFCCDVDIWHKSENITVIALVKVLYVHLVELLNRRIREDEIFLTEIFLELKCPNKKNKGKNNPDDDYRDSTLITYSLWS